MGKPSIAGIVAAAKETAKSYKLLTEMADAISTRLVGPVTLQQTKNLMVAYGRLYEMLELAAAEGKQECIAFAAEADAALFSGEVENG